VRCGQPFSVHPRHRPYRTLQDDTRTAQIANVGLVLVLGIASGVSALILFAHLADDVLRRETLALDTAVFKWLGQFRSAFADTLMAWLSLLGAEWLAVAVAALMIVLVLRRDWYAAASVTFVFAGAELLNTLLKGLFQRPRPIDTDDFLPMQQFSFPSGHAMVAASVYLFVAYFAWSRLKGWGRYAITVGLVLTIILVGASRVYLGVHYLTDVVAGYIGGFLWTDGVIIAGGLAKWRRYRRHVDKPNTVTRDTMSAGMLR
jgi:membrane-associated phospholipid phosphatase